MARGTLHIIMGNMFAGKTTELMHRIDVMREHGHKKVLILKPSTDTRSGPGKIKNFHREAMDAVEVPAKNTRSMLRVVREEEAKTGCKFDVIAIDEAQFFSKGIYHAVNRLLELGYNVICAGLRLDFKGEPFGPTLSLIGLCEGMHNVTLLHSYCAKCGKPAPLPQRIIDDKPAAYNSPQVLVGGEKPYQARCYECHELPGKPVFK